MSSEKIENVSLPTKSSKNYLKKLLTYGSWEVFFLCSPDCPKESKTSFPFYKFFYSIVSAKVSAQGALLNSSELLQ